MSDLWLSIFLLTIGAFFLVHCALASRKELKSGTALGGRWGNFDRTTSPFGFWLIMAGNLGVAVLGGAFLLAGGVGLFSFLGILK